MTFVLAWKYQNELFCIADTAVTQFKQPKFSLSSFGESQHTQEDGYNVEEGLLKIIPISNGTVIAFSGSVYYANMYIARIKSRLGTAPITDIILNVNDEIPIQSSHSLGLVILNHSFNDSPKMLVWESSVPDKFVVDCEFYAMGSLSDSIYSNVILDMLKIIIQLNRIHEEHLAIMLGFVQALGIHNNLMQHGVGGAILGLRLHSSGYNWQEDVSYHLHPRHFPTSTSHKSTPKDKAISTPSLDSFKIITSVVRDNGLAVSSSITGGPKFILNRSSLEISPEAWINRWETKLRTYFNSLASKYHIFISLIPNSIVIIKTDGGPPNNKYFRLSLIEGTRYIFSFSTELLNLLQRPPTKVESDEISYLLEFKTATEL